MKKILLIFYILITKKTIFYVNKILEDRTLKKISESIHADEFIQVSLNYFKIHNDSKQIYSFLDQFKKLYISLSSNELNTSIKFEKKILNILETLDCETFKVREWKVFYYLTSLNGRFILANEFREKALNLSIQKEFNLFSNPLFWDYKFKALIEMNRVDEAQLLLNKISFTPLRFFYPIKFLNISAYMYKNNNFSKIQKFYKLTIPTNKKYFRYIKNKSISVVGPSPSEKDLQSEIDEKDIIVRLNVFEKRDVSENSFKGTKTDISYYNGENSFKMLNTKDRKFTENLKFTVFQGFIQKKLDYEFKNIFKRLITSEICFLCDFNMIQNLLFDLLLYEPKTVKLFSTNFYASQNKYERDYRPRNDLIPNKYNQDLSFTIHNPIAQIRFIKNLYINNVIDVDDECKRILYLSDREYLSILEENS